jgi:Tfp pilus assembly protein PilF
VSNTEAYELVLQGRYFFNRRADGDLDRARDKFERALQLDSDIAEAWIGLVPLYTWGMDPPDLVLARAAAEKALTFEPNNAEAHMRMALVYSYEGNKVARNKEFEIAIELGPNNPLILSVRAGYLFGTGDMDGGIEAQQRAASIDPMSAVYHNNLAAYLESAGRFDESLDAIETAEDLNPGDRDQQKLRGRVRLQQGHAKKALELFQALPDDWEKTFYLSLAYYSLGNLDASDSVMLEYQEKYSSEYPQGMAAIFAWRGDADSAFLWLEKCKSELGCEYDDVPFLKTLHKDPRWAALRE